MVWESDRRLWLNEDRSAVVEDGDPSAAHLFAAGPGDEVLLDDAKRYGLVDATPVTHLSPGHVLAERLGVRDVENPPEAAVLDESAFPAAGAEAGDEAEGAGPVTEDKAVKGPRVPKPATEDKGSE